MNNAYILFDGRGYISGVFSSEDRMLAAKKRYLTGTEDKWWRKGNRYTYADSLSLEIDFLWNMLVEDRDMYKVVQTYDLDCVVAIEKMTPSVCLHNYEELVIAADDKVVVVYNIWATSEKTAYSIAKEATHVEGIRCGLRMYKGASNG
jgi:hypothetical protein